MAKPPITARAKTDSNDAKVVRLLPVYVARVVIKVLPGAIPKVTFWVTATIEPPIMTTTAMTIKPIAADTASFIVSQTVSLKRKS